MAAALLGAACSDDDDGGAPAAAERNERDALDVPPEVAGGAAGWPAPTDDTIVWPIGQAERPALVAYRVRG